MCSTTIPGNSGFVYATISYVWICKECAEERIETYRLHPGWAVVLPSPPNGWTICCWPDGHFFDAYCPKHVVETRIVELPLSDTATAAGNAAGSGRDANPQADAGELPTQTAACGGLTSS